MADNDRYTYLLNVGTHNLRHALTWSCNDPDCEIHNPEVIEDDANRLTHQAFFLAGATTLIDILLRDERTGDWADITPVLHTALMALKDTHVPITTQEG